MPGEKRFFITLADDPASLSDQQHSRLVHHRKTHSLVVNCIIVEEHWTRDLSWQNRCHRDQHLAIGNALKKTIQALLRRPTS